MSVPRFIDRAIDAVGPLLGGLPDSELRQRLDASSVALDAESTIRRVRTTRVYCAGVVLGATLAAAVWLYTYRVWDTVEYIDRTGYHFRPSEHVRTTPWWSVYATVALIFTGAAVSLWLLPEHRRLIQRFAARFVMPS